MTQEQQKRPYKNPLKWEDDKIIPDPNTKLAVKIQRAEREDKTLVHRMALGSMDDKLEKFFPSIFVRHEPPNFQVIEALMQAAFAHAKKQEGYARDRIQGEKSQRKDQRPGLKTLSRQDKEKRAATG